MLKSLDLSSRGMRVVAAAAGLGVVFALLFSGAASANYVWSSTGGPAGDGVMSCVPDSSGSNLYVGDMTAGKVWRYDIAGDTWTDWPGLGGGWVRGLAFDPGHGASGTLYAGTGERLTLPRPISECNTRALTPFVALLASGQFPVAECDREPARLGEM